MHISQENDHQQAATVFVDGAPMHGSVIAGLEDAERIEVVRGPQSAYFGRATLAGAVNFVTKTPGQESKSKVVAEFGKYGTTNLGASFEGPLSDTVSYRVAVSSQDTDGQYKAANDPSLTLENARPLVLQEHFILSLATDSMQKLDSTLGRMMMVLVQRLDTV